MVRCQGLLIEIGKELQAVTEQLLRHPYVQALEEGKIGRAELCLFAGEQYNIIASDLKSAAYLVSRFGSALSGDFFLGILQGETSCLRCPANVRPCLGPKRSATARARATVRRSRLHLLHGVACALCL